MAGHSKWHNIKRQKGAKDAQRSKVFSKISRLIIVAARSGDDPDSNPALRLAVQKAKDARMPKDNIERAIKKGSGNLEGETYEEVIYEGFGPNGGGLVIKCLTDNNNRTVSEIRSLLSRSGGNMGAKGSAMYIFDSENNATFFVTLNSDSDKEKVSQLLEDLDDHDDVQEVLHNYKFE